MLPSDAVATPHRRRDVRSIARTSISKYFLSRGRHRLAERSVAELPVKATVCPFTSTSTAPASPRQSARAGQRPAVAPLSRRLCATQCIPLLRPTQCRAAVAANSVQCARGRGVRDEHRGHRLVAEGARVQQRSALQSAALSKCLPRECTHHGEVTRRPKLAHDADASAQRRSRVEPCGWIRLPLHSPLEIRVMGDGCAIGCAID